MNIDLGRRVVWSALLILANVVVAAPAAAREPSTDRNASELGLDPIFNEGFEAGECAAWSSTSHGPAAWDFDDDDFGDASQPVVYCVLPLGLVADATDCDDDDDAIHPGAPELCDTADNDCNPASVDGNGELWIGQLCDGADSDLCDEGGLACVNGSPLCTDQSVASLDLCNGEDEDCDPASVDGSEDPLIGAACDSPVDTDFCSTGANSCAAGSLACSDDSASTPETCSGNFADEDCDGEVDEGFPRDSNPLCTNGVFSLGTIAGDSGNANLNQSSYNEVWDSFTLSESMLPESIYLSATIQLNSPPGVDYDLYVYCFNCAGGVVASSTVHNLTGHLDTVQTRADDDAGESETHVVMIEVRHVSSNLCALWTLNVWGNTQVLNVTCNP